MLIIGHRGSAGTKPQNTVTSLREAIKVGAEMVEFDVRLTKDKVPILHHGFSMYDHKRMDFIGRHTLSELKKRTSGSEFPIVTLKQALDECYGKILINIEVKELQAAGRTLDILGGYVKKKNDWNEILISSFKPLVLYQVRRRAPDSHLAMLHRLNPLAFILWERQLKLTAVGFHRIHINEFALEVARQLELFTFVFTVNRPEALSQIAEKGIDGIVTDFPAAMLKVRKKL